MKEIPYVQHGKLHAPGGGVILSLPRPVDRTGWIAWLDDPRHTSFRYEAESGAECSVIKEKRKGRTGNTHHYWYCHRHVLGKLHRVYMGKSGNLTIQALEAAAGKLAQVEIGAVDGRKKTRQL